jgi:hypothetical protein
MTIPELAQAIRDNHAERAALEAEKDQRWMEWCAYYNDPANRLTGTVRVAGEGTL